MISRVVTIGVYGYTEGEFFQRLVDTHVDVLCDVRARRGVRGRRYSFANASRLQSRLHELGIKYIHLKELAPPDSVRAAQQRADQQAGVRKRQREVLSQGFIEDYRRRKLADLNVPTLLERLNGGAHVIALFCVERLPEACHRSLLADEFARQLNIEVEHLTE